MTDVLEVVAKTVHRAMTTSDEWSKKVQYLDVREVDRIRKIAHNEQVDISAEEIAMQDRAHELEINGLRSQIVLNEAVAEVRGPLPCESLLGKLICGYDDDVTSQLNSQVQMAS